MEPLVIFFFVPAIKLLKCLRPAWSAAGPLCLGFPLGALAWWKSHSSESQALGDLASVPSPPWPRLSPQEQGWVQFMARTFLALDRLGANPCLPTCPGGPEKME